LKNGNLKVTKLERGTAWFDTGTIASLSDASNYVRILEERQGSKIACPEEISWRNNWIDDNQLLKISETYFNSQYGNYLKQLLSTSSAF
jgi:glucose-1-phosphate thymidylyltransferase